MKLFLTLLSLLSACVTAYSQRTDIFPPNSVKKQIKAIPITGSIHIDGVMNEPEWSLAGLTEL
jgi:hypothetical protein